MLGNNSIATYRKFARTDTGGVTAQKGNVRMRENALYPTTQLWDDSCHTIAGLSKRSRMHIGLGRNTAYIETSAPDLALFSNNYS